MDHRFHLDPNIKSPVIFLLFAPFGDDISTLPEDKLPNGFESNRDSDWGSRKRKKKKETKTSAESENIPPDSLLHIPIIKLIR